MISIDYNSKEPIYLQIANNIKNCILKGSLKPNEQMPSIRDLANDLGVNPNTIKKSYAILEKENLIQSISTKGTFITSKIEHIIEQKIEESFQFIERELEFLSKLGVSQDKIVERVKQKWQILS